ncbi:MAG TPA: Na+/H+ antiporter NhaA [Polyangiales bacterium]|nr:Na+/H+ antiporter NhaA [Polyangiales bacterium]
MSKTSRERPPSQPPEAWRPLVELRGAARRSLEHFLRIEAASGILLLLAAAVALVWANSPWAGGYASLWHTPIGLRLGSFTFERTLEWVVNDGLMVIFFFVVGMEIRHEIHSGELSEMRRAALPVAAALGGMIAPACLYMAFAGGPATRSGWGVPMATDIAFAVGILTLLGRRVPAALRVLLLALAVIDDLGAIVVIAIFYSSGIVISGLCVAAVGLAGIFAMQRLGVRSKPAYIVPAFVLWAGVYTSGIHPTIAGVIVGLVTPVRAWFGASGFRVGVRQELEHLEKKNDERSSVHELSEVLRNVDVARREAVSPAESLIETLHPWVAYGIMPVFALANAGVKLPETSLDLGAQRVLIGVCAGLIVGKPLGVLFMSWLTLRLRVASLPAGLSFRHLTVLGVVAGVGLTMALFIAQLAFSDMQLLAAAKLGVLAASGGAAVLGVALGRWLLPESGGGRIAQTADEAESSTEL